MSNLSERETTNHRPEPPRENMQQFTLKHYVTLCRLAKQDPDLMMRINEAMRIVNAEPEVFEWNNGRFEQQV